MANEKDYRFCLIPGSKTRHVAGPPCVKNRIPHYEIEIDVPSHVRDKVEVKQFLLGTPKNCQWAWDLKNNSTWPAFVTIKKDGQRIKKPDQQPYQLARMNRCESMKEGWVRGRGGFSWKRATVCRLGQRQVIEIMKKR
jgi:hypothetical protein